MANTAGLVLTGGASRRMGRPKATITWRGERLVDRAARVLAAVCDPVLEIGPGYSSLATVLEDEPGAGPLAALDAGLRALDATGAGGRPALLLGCDLPFVDVELLRLLAERPGEGTVVPIAGGHPQVLCARYGVEAKPVAARLLAAGVRSLRALVDSLEPVFLGEEEWSLAAGPHAFADVDTPEALARWSDAGG